MKKGRYFYKLVLTISLLILVPIMVWEIASIKISYERMVKLNDAYYNDIVMFYQTTLDNKITALRMHAASIMVESKKSNSVFYDRKQEAPDSYVWYYEAIQEIFNHYDNHGVKDMGIYYYDIDKVICTAGAMNASEYLRQIEREATADTTEMLSFFRKENYSDRKVLLAASAESENTSGNLLVGFCFNFGRMREDVLVFYRLTEADIKNSLGSLYDYNDLNCSLVDREKNVVCFSLGNNINDITNYLQNQQMGKLYWEAESTHGALAIIGCLNDNSPYNVSREFLDEIIIIFIVTFIILLGGFAIVVVVLYKPVQRVVSKVGYEKGSEFEIIESILYDRQKKIEEQEIQILKSALKQLLYNLSIDSTKLQQLKILKNARYCCVFLMDSHIFTKQEDWVKKIVSEQFGAHLFMVDWKKENKSAAFLFFEKNNVSEVAEILLGLCETKNVLRDHIYGGTIVESFEELSDSLQHAYKEMKKHQSKLKREENQEKERLLVEEKEQKKKMAILEYLDEHYVDADLSMSNVAEKFGMSEYSFRTLFKKHVGKGFVDYVNGKRIESAKKMLIETDESVYLISVRVGFNGENTFFKVFKAYVGLSPSAYREGQRSKN